MLLIYRHETRMKTGYITTEDLIAPGGGRYKPARINHPQAHLAKEVMQTMGMVFLSTDRSKRLSLREAFEGACKIDPTIASFAKYLSATDKAAERILIK